MTNSGNLVRTLSEIDFPLRPCSDSGWLIVEEGFTLVREHEIESVLAIANGYVGTRASLEEGSRLSRPGTFVAGVYVDESASILGPALAVLPDWPHLEIAVEGQSLAMESGRTLEHRRMLDLRQGVLWREWRQQDPTGRITHVRILRLASLQDRHVLLQSVMVTAENYAGHVELIAGPALSEALRRAKPTVDCVSNVLAIVAGKTRVAMAIGAVLRPSSASRSIQEKPSGRLQERWSWDASLGETIRLDRAVAVYTSREEEHPTRSAQRRLARLFETGLSRVAAAHSEAWNCRWKAAEVRIVGDDEAQRALRFAVYHLVGASNPSDEHVSIGARGLTGEAYHGHVFWDTEIYMLPFYLLSHPATARSLLMYRYHTLDAARRKAEAFGCRGALYAWESADTGDETTPAAVVGPDGRIVRVLTGEQEHHISADIAYAVWQYWRTTGDDAFMIAAGGDILIETARFWASRARMEDDGHAHIRDVIGADEYHDTVDDNAYTNIMARWNLTRAVDAVAILEREQPAGWRQQRERLALGDDEPAAWRGIATALATGFHSDTGLFEQFEGYFKFAEVDVIRHRNCSMPIDVCLGSEPIRRSQAIKQADVVALSALLWDEWPRAVHQANYDYYEPRTAHGSSLSPAIYALVAARLGDGARALNYLHQAGEIDLADNMGNAAGGVHMAALAGLWQAAVFGVAGLRIREEGIALDPHFPPGWGELAFCVQWRGLSIRLTLEADPAQIAAEVEGSGELTIAVVDGPSRRGGPGQRYLVRCENSRWGDWLEIDR